MEAGIEGSLGKGIGTLKGFWLATEAWTCGTNAGGSREDGFCVIDGTNPRLFCIWGWNDCAGKGCDCMLGFDDVGLVMNIDGDDITGLNCISFDGIFMGMNGSFLIEGELNLNVGLIVVESFWMNWVVKVVMGLNVVEVVTGLNVVMIGSFLINKVLLDVVGLCVVWVVIKDVDVVGTDLGDVILSVVNCVLIVDGLSVIVVGMILMIPLVVVLTEGKVLKVLIEVDRSVVLFWVVAGVDVIQVDGILDLCGTSFCDFSFCCSSNQFSKFFVYSPFGSYLSASARYMEGCW